MNTLLNPRLSMRVFGGILLILSIAMVIDAEGFSTRGFPGSAAEAVTVATYMHQVFGASIFAFSAMMLGATMRTDDSQCIRFSRVASVAFLPSVLVMTYHWTGPLPDVMVPALLNSILWLWVLLSGYLYTPDE